MGDPDTIGKLRKLVEAERQYDVEETRRLCASLEPKTLQAKGICLLNLRVTGMRTGLGGKTLIDLEAGFSGQVPLPANRFRSGDVVSLTEHSGKKRRAATAKHQTDASLDGEGSGSDGAAEWRATVHRVDDFKMTVVIGSARKRGDRSAADNGDDDQDVPSDSLRYRVDRMADDVSYQRMLRALAEAEALAAASTPALVRVLLGLQKPTYGSILSSELDLHNTGLNEPQREAIRFALGAHELALIHGPPEIIRQLLLRKQRILVCAPSNIAVDNLVERFAGIDQPIVRLGHPSRILPAVLAASLDFQVIRSEESSLVSDTRKDIETQVKKLSKRTSKGERREIYQELRHLRKELRVREREITDRIMRNARVIFTTLAGAGSRKLGQERFDVVVVDEVCQSLEAECWIALLKGARLILAGDPHQLPPTVKSTAVATRKGLERTLFDRLKSAYGEHALRLLTVQYRMNKAIMEWANIAMYDGRLQAHESAKERTLLDLPGVQKTDDTEQVIVMVDTAGCGLLETIADDGESKSNEGEAKLCVKYVDSLLVAGVDPADIAIITPYNAQGREANVVILSLVRSNDRGEVGFLGEERRLNVAITRARRHVCLICDSDTVRNDPFMKVMVEYFEEHGDVRYAYQLDDV